MKKEKPTTKICKHCKTEIPFDAKVCPQCRKKQGTGCLTKILIFIGIIIVISFFVGEDEESSDTSEKTTTEATVEEKTTTEASTEKKTTTEATTEKKKTYNRKDYNPEITYDDLARTPDDYEYEKITFSGTVVQVIEDDENNQTQLRIATKDGYDDVIYVVFDKSITNKRILEDDRVRFYGYSCGLLTYESTMGGDITIPSAVAEHIKILD